ncbi:MAG: hypothetical protein AB8G15_01480 [Saprospiraceae bacterium]
MKKLNEIKLSAQKLFAEKEIKLVNEFLLTQLKTLNHELFNQALLLEAQRNTILRYKEEELITKEQFNVERNKLQKALNEFINNLDSPVKKETPSKKSSKKQLLKLILVVQLLILLGIGILIYMQI